MTRSDAPTMSTLDAALGLLSRRDHGRVELQRKLAQRGHEEAEIDAALARCEELGYLNEQRLVEMRVARRVEQGHGPRRISAELQQRGLASSEIETALAELDIDWAEQAWIALQSKYPGSTPNDQREKARRGRFLTQRGFDSSDIHRALRRSSGE